MGFQKITIHPAFLTTDIGKSEKGIICVILRNNTGSGACMKRSMTRIFRSIIFLPVKSRPFMLSKSDKFVFVVQIL